MQALSPRQQQILSLARQTGNVTVDDLAARFDVTPQTIRKDLNELCDTRLLARTHGGAMLSSGVENVAYEARRHIAARREQAGLLVHPLADLRLVGRHPAERDPHRQDEQQQQASQTAGGVQQPFSHAQAVHRGRRTYITTTSY